MNLDLSAIVTKLQGMAQSVLLIIPNLLIGVVLFLVFMFIARLVRNAVVSVAERAGQPRGIALVFSRIASWVVLGIGLLVALTIIFPALTAASLFGALGVSGVAIGFAFKDIFQNLLAGILILITRPFRIGDQIVTGGSEGTVEDIQVRATLLRTYDNRLVVVPNSDLYTNRVTVNTAYDNRRLSVSVGIGYGDDIAQAKKLILDTIGKIDDVLKDPAPSVLVDSLGDYSVNLNIRFWVDPPKRGEVVEAQDQVLEQLKSVLIAAGIDLPMPTQQILFHDQTETVDGDRARQREGWPARKDNPESRQQLELEDKRSAKASAGQSPPSPQQTDLQKPDLQNTGQSSTEPSA
ncbi:mechanosensitive ion channel family protein (plasmid) [Deinococcus psychrotolerans]|uniref:Mechanosensitive ion channel family protein n=1 Tax=Deinococcus psychrotolerans TaxID=2489213 RepID=A0A3G8YHQ3_9DEIO|nr:mechanosensitive ion channel family protein [Deinococcus psychrotolerans]AZI44523.1 mechanosensitive ion channel family protein [Deinococcus psychrotolerans]